MPLPARHQQEKASHRRGEGAHDAGIGLAGWILKCPMGTPRLTEAEMSDCFHRLDIPLFGRASFSLTSDLKFGVLNLSLAHVTGFSELMVIAAPKQCP